MEGEEASVESRSGESGLSTGDIQQALDRVTSLPPLSRSKRLSGFLRYIVDETLAGRAAAISGYSVAVDVFGKPDTFDPALDSIVRVEAGRLRRRLAEYYREAGAEDAIEISLTKGSYVPTFETRSASPSRHASPSPAPHRGPSIAVLPFQNYSVDPGDQFFADGLTEETTANLARFKDLFVFSRSTTATLARDGADIRRFREELGVDFVLESSVRKSPHAVRVTAQLIDAATDGHIFAEHFERPCTPEGVFQIQDEIALLVAGRVADRHGPIARLVGRTHRSGQSERWETYIWITRFYDYYATHHPERHLEVRDGLADALENDPGSSDGWAAMSTILLDEYRLHINERPSYPALERALEFSLRAVTCDPENAFAYQTLALAYFHGGEVTDFHVAADRAIGLNPGNADVLADIGFCRALLGDWDRGLPLIDRAIALSPVHPGWYRQPRAWHHMMTGDPEAAVIELKQAPMPGFFWYHAFLAGFFSELGDDAEAAREVGELSALYPDFAGNARRELEIWRTSDAMAKKMVAAWRKAGMMID